MKYFNAAMFFALCSLNTQADDAEINLADKTALFNYSIEGVMGNDSAFYDLGFLYTESDDKVVHFGITLKGRAINFPSTVYVGVRGYTGQVDNTRTITTVAIGGGFHLVPEIWAGFGIGAEGYYAAPVTSFDKTEELLDYKYFASFSLSNNAHVSLGNKVISADFKGANSIKFVNSTYAGLLFSF